MFGIDDAIIAAVAPAVIGGAMDMIGGNKQNESSEAMMNNANQFSAQQFATRYQTTTKDMQAAGLNPMLAYGAGGGSPPSSVGAAQQVNTMHGAADLSQKAIGAANLAMQTQLTDAQVNESTSRTTLNEQQAKKTDAETAAVILGMPNIPQNLKESIARTLMWNSQSGLNSANTANVKQNTIINEPEAWASKTYGKTKQAVKDVTQGVTGAKNAKDVFSIKPTKPASNYQPTINHYYPQ